MVVVVVVVVVLVLSIHPDIPNVKATILICNGSTKE